MKQQTAILHGDGLGLLVRRQQSGGHPVLYVHGATFPSALSAAYRFHGRSWMDDWNARGFDAWAFDFAGYGGSDRPAEKSDAIPGRARDAAAQIVRVVAHIVSITGKPSVSLVAHSWGTIAAALFALENPQSIHKLCMFGPILQREGKTPPATPEKWRLVTVAQQLSRFIEDVPKVHPPVLIEENLQDWGPAYLASDTEASLRMPPAVRIPGGPGADIAEAWSGCLPYDPRDLQCPVLCVRGEWDNLSTDDDARWLLSRLKHPSSRDVKIAKGTHLMHLEQSREGLFDAVGAFLSER
jgi:pimeloyl-ACP methyl ester carboxylesterase